MDAALPLSRPESPRPGREGARATWGSGPNTSPAIRLRRMGLQDLTFVTGLHRVTFREGFFVRLGATFLSRYYRTFLDGPLATALVCEKDGVVCGYLVGVIDPPEHRRLLLRHHGLSLAVTAFVNLLWRPGLALHFLRTRARRYLRALARKPRVSAGPASEARKVAVLTYVAVDPSVRGGGIGYALVGKFLDEAAAAGRSEACLVTIAGPQGAGGFYAAQGWVRVGESRRADGQLLEHYRFLLDEEA
ncbi:hypothetical protein JCM10369A_33760 [Nocardioides pyridinolyticus]